jgi:hypothetical protein
MVENNLHLLVSLRRIKMANRLLKQFSGTLDNGVVHIQGSFAPAGTGAPTAQLGKGFSVARTSAGLFTITLQDKYVSLLSGQAHLQLATGADQFVQLGTIDVASAKTVQIRVWDISAAAVADISADANNRVHFHLILKNSTV